MNFKKVGILLIVGVIFMLDSNVEAKTGVIQPVNPKNPIAVIETELGTIKAELFEDKSPITVSNFIILVEKGFYDGIIFHRIIKDFMIQTGDPQGTGMGGPGYTIQDEFHPRLKHSQAGVLSMANAGPNTGGSQFFITLVPTSWLDGKHAIFGQVIEGMNIVEKIGNVQTGSMDKPVQKISMKKVKIIKSK